MKNLTLIVITAVIFISGDFAFSQGNSGFDTKFKLNSEKDFKKEIFNRDYQKAKLTEKSKTGSLLGVSVDFQLGFNSTNANVEATGGKSDYPTDSETGFTAGAFLNLGLFESFNLTTGIDFLKKSFEVDKTNPSDTLGTPTQEIEKFVSNYFNIPLNMNVGTKLSDDIGVDLSFGPYFAFRMNDQSIDGFGYKNFDLGLNAMMTLNYALNPFMGIILGGKYQRGGLNNLGSTEYVEKVNTNMWGVFTGLRVGIGI